MSTLPPMPKRSDGELCGKCGAPRVAFPLGYASPLLPHGLRICLTCDMGGASNGPPVLLDYIRRGHHA